MQAKTDRPKFLPYLTIAYFLFLFMPCILLRKAIAIPHLGIIPISILFTGLHFMTLDIITEVYGYYEGRRVLYASLFGYVVFAIFMSIILQTPSPADMTVEWATLQDPHAYHYLFDGIGLFTVAVLVSALLGNTINMIILSKWKIALKGRYFWMRSLTTSSIAAAFYSIASVLIVGAPYLSDKTALLVIKIIIISFVSKLVTLAIFATPAAIFCAILKRIEGVDVYDYGVNYNPFKNQ
jgi:uncharacterized PurR-regulated membrane protein YhhQ (DUF165 family)